jgi:predicted dehydrogenase
VSLPSRNVVVIGLGIAGAVHVSALEEMPDIAVIAGIDTSASRRLTFRGDEVPVYPSVFDMISECRLRPDIVVVATPTSAHADVCSEVGEHFGQASIIVEKPAAGSLADAERIVRGVGGKQPVAIAYHMAFSPVVNWGLRETAERAHELGRPIAIETWYADPYQSELASARARLGDSWTDSGINALSVIERFVKPVERTSLRKIGDPEHSVFEGTFSCESNGERLPANVMTSWYSTAPSRWTRIRYVSGAELVMDHNAVAGYIRQNGEASAVFGSDGSVPRRAAHYRAMYKSLMAHGDQVFPAETSMRLHRLLLS